MASELYQEYLRVIGTLKDVHKFDVQVDHQDIHTFYRDKRPIFKLLFGIFQEDIEPSIVVSFHIDLYHPEAVGWFINIYRVHPGVAMHDSYIEDSNGETYLGKDALAIKEIYTAQEILSNWLENSSKEEMEEFTKAKVTGRKRDSKQSFHSQEQKDQATMEFDRIKKPGSADEVH